MFFQTRGWGERDNMLHIKRNWTIPALQSQDLYNGGQSQSPPQAYVPGFFFILSQVGILWNTLYETKTGKFTLENQKTKHMIAFNVIMVG